jgi:hypothetical protein
MSDEDLRAAREKKIEKREGEKEKERGEIVEVKLPDNTVAVLPASSQNTLLYTLAELVSSLAAGVAFSRDPALRLILFTEDLREDVVPASSFSFSFSFPLLPLLQLHWY